MSCVPHSCSVSQERRKMALGALTVGVAFLPDSVHPAVRVDPQEEASVLAVQPLGILEVPRRETSAAAAFRCGGKCGDFSYRSHLLSSSFSCSSHCCYFFPFPLSCRSSPTVASRLPPSCLAPSSPSSSFSCPLLFLLRKPPHSLIRFNPGGQIVCLKFLLLVTMPARRRQSNDSVDTQKDFEKVFTPRLRRGSSLPSLVACPRSCAPVANGAQRAAVSLEDGTHVGSPFSSALSWTEIFREGQLAWICGGLSPVGLSSHAPNEGTHTHIHTHTHTLLSLSLSHTPTDSKL